LKAEYFKNINLEGEPFYTKIDPLEITNWIYGTRIPNIRGLAEFSIRWSGKITFPEEGDYNFTVKGENGYRLIINNQTIIEDWNDHSYSIKSNTVHLEKNEPYDICVEYFKKSTWRGQLFLEWQKLNVDYMQEAIDVAKNSDAIIFVGGITAQLEGEEMRVDYEGFRGGDRTSLDLPKVQENLLKLLKLTGKPIILVLTSGSALSVNWEKENLAAIIQLWYPGQEGGTALADVLFGDYNPAGRLPVTFYKSVDQLPPFEDYNMKGRTYRYFEGEPLFPFGYGLSYTKFEYSNMTIPNNIKTGDEIKISVEVKNTGKVTGDEVVQVYVKTPECLTKTPIHSLQGFKRIHLNTGEKQIVEFTLKPKQIAAIGEDVQYIVEPGTYEISVGGTQPGTKAETTGYVSSKVEVTGDPFVVE
jgi:beta-glucosidase